MSRGAFPAIRRSASARVGMVSAVPARRSRTSSAALRAAIGPLAAVSRSSSSSWKTIAAPSRLAWTSSSIPDPAAIAAAKAARLFSGRPGPCRPRWAKGRAPRRSSSACLDLDDGIDLDRRPQRKHRHADRAAGVAAGLAEHLLHQLRRAIGDLGLVGEGAGAVDEDAELNDPLDPVEAAQSPLHLGEQHQPAGPRGAHAVFEAQILAELAGDQGAILERDLT